MRLTRVEIHGFKSFSDRTQLQLPPGLTAVVGPNGCGKSNIIDAIKWALGEQRAMALRGDAMLDVIFKGNGTRPARNFAEVSLVFDNTDGVLPLEFAEVVITRRLFKSGESEYLINKNSVRLKDIRNLFLDTGLGKGSYSIMEQGRIDAVLSANATDRRRIFEEAAGIARYRARRRESESKLERTEQNLLRIGDVVDELEKRQRSLKYQAGRAKSYVEARDRVRELKSLDYAHKWGSYAEQMESLAVAVREHEQAEQAAREAVESARRELAALQGQLGEARGGIDEAAEAFRKATAAVDALAERQAALSERLEEIEVRQQGARGRSVEHAQVLAGRQQEQERAQQRLTEVQAERVVAEATVSERETQVAAARAALADWDGATDERRRVALQRASELTDRRNERAEAASRLAALTATHERLSERLTALRAEGEQLTLTQGELFAGVRDLDAAMEQVNARAESAESARRKSAEALARVEGQQAGLRERLAGLRSRRDALAELIASRDGVAAGAVMLLDAGLPGIEGLLVDHLRAPRNLAESVEAALGASGQALVVDTAAHASEALAHLRLHNGGRVRLLPRDRLTPRQGAAAGTRLIDEIEIVGDRATVEALLGHVRLVDDADAFARCSLDGVTVWVTPAGELLDERGVVHGGQLHGGQGGDEGGLVARRAECDALEGDAERLHERTDALAHEREQAEAALQVALTELTESQKHVRRTENERERAREAERQATERRDEIARQLAVLVADCETVEEDRQQAEQTRATAAGREQQLEQESAAERQEEERREARRAELVTALEAAQSEQSLARTELSTLAERSEALESEGRQIARALAEREVESKRVQEELATLEADARRLAEERDNASARAAELAEERDRCAGDLDAAKSRAGSFQQHLEAAQAAVGGQEEAAATAGESLAAVRMKRQEVEIHRDGLRERVLEELEIDFTTQPPPPAEAATDHVAVEKELEQLRERLARMGNVNMEAIDELAEVEQRVTFLAGQRDDLVGARKSLNDTISAVNKESRERFLAAFEEVREHFRTIFRKLFQGGRADIFLEEGVDVLDAGIEIVAAPPGKDQRSISLLSGGERTLTAVGLLFALFRARPSPVCMLDEVDAALDETNIDRFCSVLEDFLDQSQFIVVTHARRTMSYADTLYGVTMQEHGVSKVISIDLEQAGEHVEPPKRGQKESGGDDAPGKGADRLGDVGPAQHRVDAGPDVTSDVSPEESGTGSRIGEIVSES